MSKQRQILVTSALPYANGAIHLGHLVEHVQADIWARFQKMQGHKCLFICGDDAHGTPIMLKANEKGISPETLINQMYQEHVHDFALFHIDFDNYHTTHSEENHELVNYIYHQLQANDDITVKTIEQAYDPVQQMFLPDRFVKGQCPRCYAEGQYGDNCEACGAHYSPAELINPVSALSKATPIHKTSEHYFFRLDKYQDFLHHWIHNDTLQPEVANKLEEWFQAGLEQWDISRDAPYFGFPIPNHPDKYFYVWLDAPIGYMASLKNLASREHAVMFDDYWSPDSQSELYHFVGKDIIYFHALFWPAMLKSAQFRQPDAIYTHGFLTINGQKMSKSRGTFINARQFADHVNPDCFRYYLAGKLSNTVEDIDLNFEDFVARINSDLVGKFINIASRCSGFITKRFQSQMASELHDPSLFDYFANHGDMIAQYYEQREYHKAIRVMMNLADQANQYINTYQPWLLIKQEDGQKQAHQVCTQALNLFKTLAVYLKPVMPKIIADAEQFLNVEPLNWSDSAVPLTDHTIQRFKPLLKRLQLEQVQAITNHTNYETAQSTHDRAD